MSFGHQPDVHNHLFPKRQLFSYKMSEDDTKNEIVEPEQHEGPPLSFVLEDIERRLEILIENAHVLEPFMAHRLKSF